MWNVHACLLSLPSSQPLLSYLTLLIPKESILVQWVIVKPQSYHLLSDTPQRTVGGAALEEAFHILSHR